jgi:enoyl-CoA hydratase/carnithine racemase
VVPDAELLPAARELAGRIAANPPHAVRMARRLLREAWNNRLDTVLEMSAAMQAVAHTTATTRRPWPRLREKRRPRFSGA